MRPSDKAIQALQIVSDHGPMTPTKFASRMWSLETDSESPSLSGYVRKAGEYLAWLQQRGWVALSNSAHEYYLTKLGAETLVESFINKHRTLL